MIDEAAMASLYQRYGPAVFRRGLRLLGNPEDARELVQQVFLEFWRGRDRFEGRSSAFTYLYRIATNRAIDRLRRRTTAGHSVEVEKVEPQVATRVGPDRTVHALAHLAELTSGLDEETLTVAVMSHVDGLTQDEIAEVLDLSRRTIGKRLKHFLRHTRDRAGLVDQARVGDRAEVLGNHGQ